MIGVDASVAAKWIFSEVYSEQANALRDAAIASGTPIVAPALLPLEVTNIVRQRMKEERLPLPLAQRCIENFLAVPVRLVSPSGLESLALAASDSYGLPG